MNKEDLCKTLKAYVEEYGAENVSVNLPRSWEKYANDSSYLGRVKTYYTTDNLIRIEASIFPEVLYPDAKISTVSFIQQVDNEVLR